jgi:hypothetical protein
MNPRANATLEPPRGADRSVMLEREPSQHEVRCGMCGKTMFVDEETFWFVNDAIKAGLDVPFRCEKCKQEYDDLVYEG